MSASDRGASASTSARRRAAAAAFYSLNPGIAKSLYSGAAGQENSVKVAGLLAQPPCCVSAIAPVPVLYTVTYDANGGTGSPTDPASPYAAGMTVTVLGPGSLVRSGYIFTGWNTVADGSGTGYAAGSTFVVGGATTLFAQWTPSYTVTYTGDLSTGGAPPVDTLSPYAAGSTVTVLDNNNPEGVLVRSGYTFLGWYPAGFVHAGTYYVAGNQILLTSDLTLLPYWEEDMT